LHYTKTALIQFAHFSEMLPYKISARYTKYRVAPCWELRMAAIFV